MESDLHSFLTIATAHFLALLSPGPDFLLILRHSTQNGWRRAIQVCIGIALGNGLFIIVAFSGFRLLDENSTPFIILQLVGTLYLFYLSTLFLRSACAANTENAFMNTTVTDRQTLGNNTFIQGLLCSLLNPKNGLFYISLFSFLAAARTPLTTQALYGLWMFTIVLGWDLLMAAILGNRLVVRHVIRNRRIIEGLCGIMLLVLAGFILTVVLLH